MNNKLSRSGAKGTSWLGSYPGDPKAPITLPIKVTGKDGITVFNFTINSQQGNKTEETESSQ